MDSPGNGEGLNLPPPPPRPPGVVPRTLSDVLGPSNSETQELQPPGKKIKQAAVLKFPQMTRPSFGTSGSKVDLVCNHFKVTFRPSKPVFQYNVTIEPPTLKGLNRKIMETLHATYGQEFLKGKHYAYDGEKSLFVVGSLSSKTNEFSVLLDDDPARARKGGGGRGRPGREFVVTLVHVATVDMKAIDAVLRGQRDDKLQDALRVLDIMLREHAAKKSYLLLKDTYFPPPTMRDPDLHVGDGVYLRRGFHVSFRPTTGGLSLNFDLATTLLIKPGSVMEFLSQQLKKPVNQFRQEDWMKARRLLKNVLIDYFGRKHKIIGFSPESCTNQTFPKRMRTGGGDEADPGNMDVTVAQYFENDKNVRLKYPQFPALDVGRPSKAVYLPIELCDILPGQRYKRSLNTMQRQKQIDFTRQPPEERRQLIKTAMMNNDYNNDELIKDFNVNIDQDMKFLTGRVLVSPKLTFGKNVNEIPRNGRWNFAGKTMRKAVNIPNWGVAYFRGRFPLDARKIATEMKKVCGEKGMTLGEFILVEEDINMKNSPPQERVHMVVDKLGTYLRQFTGKNVPEAEKPFILAILPEKSPDLYIPFKRKCEVEIGIVSQCIVPPKGQVNPKYLTSVSLKINLKRGGYNSVLSSEELHNFPKISKIPTIIFGLDVSHGSPGDANSPSVAAAVATVDWPRLSRFTTSIRAQASKMEMIQDLYIESQPTDMVRDLLLNFYQFENKRVKPDQILIYRDGVSESQFEQVLEDEVYAFKRACQALEADYNPKITMVVVQKRHHTRFFPARGSGNVVPGTIVDRDPCHPGSYDFYLVSHNGIIGTSRPTHYHVLYDEIGFTPDELQGITHSLCYSYTRCTSAVSVVAPAYYAHLAAQHCRNFVVDNYDSGSDSSLLSTRLEKSKASLPNIQKSVLKTMFYA